MRNLLAASFGLLLVGLHGPSAHAQSAVRIESPFEAGEDTNPPAEHWAFHRSHDDGSEIGCMLYAYAPKAPGASTVDPDAVVLASVKGRPGLWMFASGPGTEHSDGHLLEWTAVSSVLENQVVPYRAEPGVIVSMAPIDRAVLFARASVRSSFSMDGNPQFRIASVQPVSEIERAKFEGCLASENH